MPRRNHDGEHTRQLSGVDGICSHGGWREQDHLTAKKTARMSPNLPSLGQRRMYPETKARRDDSERGSGSGRPMTKDPFEQPGHQAGCCEGGGVWLQVCSRHRSQHRSLVEGIGGTNAM